MKFSKVNFNIIIAGIFSTLIAIGFGRFIYTPILPNMQNELYLNSTNMGMISSLIMHIPTPNRKIQQGKYLEI